MLSYSFQALYSYVPQNEDELELQEGDLVSVMEKCDDGWFVGMCLGPQDRLPEDIVIITVSQRVTYIHIRLQQSHSRGLIFHVGHFSEILTWMFKHIEFNRVPNLHLFCLSRHI